MHTVDSLGHRNGSARKNHLFLRWEWNLESRKIERTRKRVNYIQSKIKPVKFSKKFKLVTTVRTYIPSMVGVNSETVLPKWIASIEVVEINVKQICSSRLVVFAVKNCVRIKLGGRASDVCPGTYIPRS